MTLAMVLRCADGLVMASDSRVSGGARGSADISEKFLQVNRDVGIMTYGLAIPGYRGIRSLVEDVRQNPGAYPTVSSITSRAETLCQQVYQSFLQEQRQPDGSLPAEVSQGIVGYIIGGYDGNETARFVIYSCSSPDSFQFQEQLGTWFMAAQWHLAAWLFPFLEYLGMSIDYGLKVCVILMILTSIVEPTVGGPIHIATVTIEEGFTLLHEREVAKLVREVQPYLIALKQAWLEAWSTA